MSSERRRPLTETPIDVARAKTRQMEACARPGDLKKSRAYAVLKGIVDREDRPVSAETENLAEAEQEVRYAVECGDEVTVDRDVLRTVMAEYSRRGSERDEAQGLLRDLVKFRRPRAGNYLGGSAIRDAEDAAWSRAEALVKRTNQGDQT